MFEKEVQSNYKDALAMTLDEGAAARFGRAAVTFVEGKTEEEGKHSFARGKEGKEVGEMGRGAEGSDDVSGVENEGERMEDPCDAAETAEVGMAGDEDVLERRVGGKRGLRAKYLRIKSLSSMSSSATHSGSWKPMKCVS
jgi:hypothetical protein